MIRFHPSREPVAWLTLVVIIAQIIIGVLTHNLDTTLWTSLSSALAGVGIRQTVWSPSSHEGELADVVSNLLGEPEH